MTLIERAEQVIARCRRLALCTEVPGETTRLSFTSAMHQVHALLRAWMEAAGMTVAMDTAGNLRALYPAMQPDAKRLVIASHLDTVPNAGAFDGILGVVLGLALIEQLSGKHLPYAVEIIGFSDEEGVRFGKPFLGTQRLFGPLDPATLACIDKTGITVAEAMQVFAAQLPSPPIDPALALDAFAYLEFHIEQGPVLESLDRSLGVVAAIAGQTRLQLTFTGQSNHAGTTPMHLRRDALAAAAEWMVAVEACAGATPGLVATVGRIEVFPGAINVIPGQVTASLDVRHADDTTRQAAVVALLAQAEQAARTRAVTLTTTPLHDQAAVRMDRDLVHVLQDAVAQSGVYAEAMISGAGHDAMIVAAHLPAVMLFIRSPGGLSHHPDETVRSEDVAAALSAATRLLAALATLPLPSFRGDSDTRGPERSYAPIS